MENCYNFTGNYFSICHSEKIPKPRRHRSNQQSDIKHSNYRRRSILSRSQGDRVPQGNRKKPTFAFVSTRFVCFTLNCFQQLTIEDRFAGYRARETESVGSKTARPRGGEISVGATETD